MKEEKPRKYHTSGMITGFFWEVWKAGGRWWYRTYRRSVSASDQAQLIAHGRARGARDAHRRAVIPVEEFRAKHRRGLASTVQGLRKVKRRLMVDASRATPQYSGIDLRLNADIGTVVVLNRVICDDQALFDGQLCLQAGQPFRIALPPRHIPCELSIEYRLIPEGAAGMVLQQPVLER